MIFVIYLKTTWRTLDNVNYKPCLKLIELNYTKHNAAIVASENYIQKAFSTALNDGLQNRDSKIKKYDVAFKGYLVSLLICFQYYECSWLFYWPDFTKK